MRRAIEVYGREGLDGVLRYLAVAEATGHAHVPSEEAGTQAFAAELRGRLCSGPGAIGRRAHQRQPPLKQAPKGERPDSNRRPPGPQPDGTGCAVLRSGVSGWRVALSCAQLRSDWCPNWCPPRSPLHQLALLVGGLVVGVDHRRLDVAVTEPLLQGPHRHPGRRHLGAEGVAKIVEADPADPGRVERVLEPRRARSRVERPAGVRDGRRRGRRRPDMRSAGSGAQARRRPDRASAPSGSTAWTSGRPNCASLPARLRA